MFAALIALLAAASRPATPDVRLVTLAPGHFHAALVQREEIPGIDPTVHVYAPLGFDLTEHLKRVASFNTRAEAPTSWRLEVHAGPNWLDRFRKERPGNVAVISGRNRGKLDLVRAAIDGGMHALVDKPWIVEPGDYDRLVALVADAQRKRRITYDVMTERYEVTNQLQRELVATSDVFGTLERGTPEQPAVVIENAHHFFKQVAGAPNVRPVWFFDSREQGEAMADTGTHLVDLVLWTVAPEQAIDRTKDVQVLAAQRWPTKVTLAQWQQVTATAGFPAELAASVNGGALSVLANAHATFTVRGVHVGVTSLWDWRAPVGGGDWHWAVYRGSRARIEVRQGVAEHHRPELYVVPNRAADAASIRAALEARLGALAKAYPGLSVVAAGNELRVGIPEALRVPHEAHFAQVTRAFLRVVRDPRALAAWETPNLLTKYWITTRATELSRQGPPRVWARQAPR